MRSRAWETTIPGNGGVFSYKGNLKGEKSTSLATLIFTPPCKKIAPKFLGMVTTNIYSYLCHVSMPSPQVKQAQARQRSYLYKGNDDGITKIIILNEHIFLNLCGLGDR